MFAEKGLKLIILNVITLSKYYIKVQNKFSIKVNSIARFYILIMYEYIHLFRV